MSRHNAALDPGVGLQGLRVEREDIQFRSVSATDVRIAVTVHNDGASFLAPTTMKLEAAPLGAFLPWTPLGSVDVPAIPPGEALIIETVAKRSASGSFDSTPSTAWESAEPADRRGYERISRALLGDAVVPETPLNTLPETWVGNVNVFIGGTSVERHLAEHVPIVPGYTNKAIFFVGDGPDAYMIQMRDVPPDWGVHIYGRDQKRRNEFIQPSDDRILPGEWWDIQYGGIVYLNLDIPRGSWYGQVTVNVTQRSTNKTAVVEFGF